MTTFMRSNYFPRHKEMCSCLCNGPISFALNYHAVHEAEPEEASPLSMASGAGGFCGAAVTACCCFDCCRAMAAFSSAAVLRFCAAVPAISLAGSFAGGAAVIGSMRGVAAGLDSCGIGLGSDCSGPEVAAAAALVASASLALAMSFCAVD